MVSARCCGSSGSKGSGRPCATSQKAQRRVHLSPMIMKVAVPLLKHSFKFGQEASSHTVCNLFSRNIFFKSSTFEEEETRMRIQSGLRRGGAEDVAIRTGIFASFSAPRSFPASILFMHRFSENFRNKRNNVVDCFFNFYKIS